MKQQWFKLCSLLLVMVLVVNMLPMSVWAGEISVKANDNTAISSPTITTTEGSSIKTHVLGEEISKRTEYSKDFLLSNGNHVAAVYADPIHYEKDGSWQEIDNTLKTTTDGKFVNTAGAWAVALPQSISKTAPVTVSRDGHELSFFMSGELRTQGNLEVAAIGQTTETATVTVDGKAQTFQVSSAQTVAGQVQTIDTAAAKAAAQHPELILDKNASALMYSGVYANTQLRYDLHGSTLKESVILQSYSSNLRGYRYTLNTGDLLPLLNEDGSILFLDESKEIVFVMKAPYLIDDAEQCSNDVRVSLTGSDGTYTLTYLLPTAWLASADRAWPVVLDPAVTTAMDVMNTRDHTVASNGSYHYERPVLECGYGNVNHVQRIFLKYRVLPTLTSSDVIVDAQVALYKIENSDSIVTVDVHKVLSTWESETLTWTNKPSFDSTIEDYALIDELGYYYWNVTDIVRGWYSGANTGMMFKASDQYEDGSAATWKQFASSDNGASEWMPSLQITYRNNNGIEDYWNYSSASAGRAGTGYVNSYTGNLTWIRSDMGFGGNRMPVYISHAYNLNDSASNEFGMGYGWRTNFNQQITSTYINNHKYYIWEDSDGTSHYFYNESYGVFKDEDNLNLTLRSVNVASDTDVLGGQYSITDKGGSVKVFDSNGRLIRQLNNQKEKSYIAISYTSDGKIDYVTDGVGRKYDFTYTSGLLTKIEYLGSGTTALFTTSFTYTDGNLTRVTDKDGEYSTYTYSGHVLTSASDIDGYKLQYTYNTPSGTHQPYRVQSIQETDVVEENGVATTKSGGNLSIQYDHNQTTFTNDIDKDNEPDNTQILQFNNLGNVTCIQDDEGHAQYDQYATDIEGDSAKGNQLMISSKLQNTVGNLLDDSSFENGTLWHPSGNYETDNSISQSVSYLGSKSLCIGSANSAISSAFSIPAGTTYTFSAYVKTEGRTAILALGGKTSEVLAANKDWTRLEVSYTNEGAEAINVTPMVQTQGTSGNVYVDCVQLEKAQTASRYNLVENGDFRHEKHWSTDSGRTMVSDVAAPTLDSNVYQIIGNPQAKNRIDQTIQVSGDEGDNLVLTGWAKGDSAHVYKDDDLPEGQNTRVYALYGTFNYTDGTTSDPFIAHFNPDTDQWQYSAQVMVAKQAYSSVKVELVYDYNVNTVYFDGIQLYKEEFGNFYAYDEEDNIKSIVDLRKQKTEYEYNENNDLVKETLPSGVILTYEYDAYHNLTLAKTENEEQYSYAYDDWGNNLSVTITSKDGSVITSSATYSIDGNYLVSTTDALGKVTTYDYNPNTGVLNWVKYPEDGDGTEGTTDTRTKYEYYEETLQLKKVSATAIGENASPLSLQVEYTYTDDLLTKIQTPSTAYNFTHGAFALRTNVAVGEQVLATYTYKNVTNLPETLEYGNGNKVEYAYDTKGRVTEQVYEDGDTVTYTYDNNGALATVTDSETGIKTAYYYDFTNRMMKYVESGTNYSHSVGYEYDNINNLTATVETINGVDCSTSYTYDQDNRITSKQTGNTKIVYTYDEFSRIEKQETKKLSGEAETLVLTETFTYKPGSSQIATYATATSTVTKTYSYEYDGNGNITSITSSTSGDDVTYTTSYVYDTANQLIRENNQEKGYTHTWTYDSAGNITNNGRGEYTTGEAWDDYLVEYSYSDDWGDLLTAYGEYVITYDEIGNPVRIQDDGEMFVRTYTWQHGRQLASATYNDVMSEMGPVTWDFTYNADGLRTQRTDGATTYNYIYNGSQLTAMTVGTNTLYFSYDAAGVPMSVNFNGTEYFYTSNIQGDVTGIVNSNGVTVVTYTYDAWGNQLSCTGSMASTLGTINPLRYRGYVYDQETHLYYLQSRYYNPEIGRFLSADILANTTQGINCFNLYLYSGNNPVCRIDPTGYFWSKLVATVKAIVTIYKARNGMTDSRDQELLLYAATVYAEAGGQNWKTKKVIAHSVINRIQHDDFEGDSVTDVITDKDQYAGYGSIRYDNAMTFYQTGFCDDSLEKKAMFDSLICVIPIYEGKETDMSGGVVLFHSYPNQSDSAYHNKFTPVYIDGTEGFWFFR